MKKISIISILLSIVWIVLVCTCGTFIFMAAIMAPEITINKNYTEFQVSSVTWSSYAFLLIPISMVVAAIVSCVLLILKKPKASLIIHSLPIFTGLIVFVANAIVFNFVI